MPTAFLDGVHSLGIPWCAAIPITAITVRGIFGWYLAVRPARQRREKRILLHPLANARTNAHMAQFRHHTAQMWQDKSKRPTPAAQRFIIGTRSMWARFKETRYVGKAFGAPMFTWNNWFNFAVLIAFAEALRIKCGTREGLLSLIFGPLVPTESTNAQATSSDPAEALADRILAATEAQKSKQDGLLSSESLPDGDALANGLNLPPLNTSAYADMIDPSLRVEGFAWLQDLTVPDPNWTLPGALAALMLANVFLRPKVITEDDRVTEIQEKLKRLNQSNASKSSSSEERPKMKQSRQPEPVKSTTATNDVLHAMEVAEKLRLETAEKRRKSANIVQKIISDLSPQKRMSVVFGFLFLGVAQQLPAALVLYMASAMGTAWLQARWIDVKYPMRQPIEPCRRPMRLKVKQEYADV